MEREQLVSTVTAAQSGDSDALNTLFNEYYNDLYYFALKTLKDDETALDVTQEAFVEIINTLGNLKEPAAFVTWAKQITYHQCTRFFKKKKDVIVDEDEDGNTVFDTLKEDNAEFIPDEALDQADFKATVLAILDELSEEQRSATMMYYFDEMSVHQIAEIQGVSEGTIKSRLNYARKSIKASVEEYEKKNNVKLHAIPFFPFFRWLFKGSFEGGLPLASAKVVAEGVTAATGATVTVVGATATAATIATTATTAAAVGIGAKIAAIPLAAKIVAGVVAAAIAVGGGTAAVVLSNKDKDTEKTDTKTQSSVSDVVSSDDETEETEENLSRIEVMKTWDYETALNTYAEMLIKSNTPFFNSPKEIDVHSAIQFAYPVGETTHGTFGEEATEFFEAYFGRTFSFDSLNNTDASYENYEGCDNLYIYPFELHIMSDDEFLSFTDTKENPDGSFSKEFSLCKKDNDKITVLKTATMTVKHNGTFWNLVSYKGSENGDKTDIPDEKPNQGNETPPQPEEEHVCNWDFTVPSGCSYTTVDGKTYNAGEIVEQLPSTGDKFTTSDYIYSYNYEHYQKETDNAGKITFADSPSFFDGWCVVVKDKTKTSYPELLSEIGAIPLLSMSGTFEGCTKMTVSPKIPSSVWRMSGTYANCKSLISAPKLPEGILQLSATFYACESLVTAPEIPKTTYDIGYAFFGCKSLVNAPYLHDEIADISIAFQNCSSLKSISHFPSNLKTLNRAFIACSSLESVPAIPKSVIDLEWAFGHCTSLTGNIEINANITNLEKITSCFLYTEKPITLSGSCQYLNEIAATSEAGNVTVK